MSYNTYLDHSNMNQRDLTDLNSHKIPNADGPEKSLENLSTSSSNGDTHLFFRDIERELLSQINEADFVVGCVAWLTSSPIIEALATKLGVSIIVQKEDFLRPDQGADSSWNQYVATLYSKLQNGLNRHDGGLSATALSGMSVHSDDGELEPIRCVGNHNSEKKPAFPRMHNKFMVFCRKLDGFDDYEPYAVWTGSYNLTKNAANSFENAILLTDKKIVQAYFEEFGQIAALSEPLNWEYSWVAPEFRIGT